MQNSYGFAYGLQETAWYSPQPGAVFLNGSSERKIKMTNAEVVRAWKDPDFRAGLSTTEMSLLPDNPAGKLDLSDSQVHDTYVLSRVVCGSTPVDSCVKPPAQCP